VEWRNPGGTVLRPFDLAMKAGSNEHAICLFEHAVGAAGPHGERRPLGELAPAIELSQAAQTFHTARLRRYSASSPAHDAEREAWQ